jgi:hypothetical protein
MKPFSSSDDDTTPDLDALLRQAQSAPLPDDGFSARVLRALPSPRREAQRSAATRRTILCMLGLAAGMVLGLARNEETTWAPLLALREKIPTLEQLNAAVRWDSPLWMAVLALGGTYAILKFLERPRQMWRE